MTKTIQDLKTEHDTAATALDARLVRRAARALARKSGEPIPDWARAFKNSRKDRRTHEAPRGPKGVLVARLNRPKQSGFKPRSTETRDPKADAAALDALCARRPLKPPPFDFGPPRSTAAAVSAREDRLGVAVRPRT
jgi:hypothetical protein